MRRIVNSLGGVTLGAAVMVQGVSAFAADDIYLNDGSLIDYRQQIMKTMDAQVTAIGQVLTKTVPNENIVSHFEVLLATTIQAKVAFENKALGGDSLPIIWDEWEHFSGLLDEAEKEIGITITRIKDVGPDAAWDASLSALACKSCHDTYRAKK